MASKKEIIEALATDRVVEAMVENIAHHTLTADLKDLCQMVYIILLEYDEEKLQDLWNNDQMRFFLARVILNQYRSNNSPFYKLFRKFQERSVYMGSGADINDAAIEKLNMTFIPRREREK